jgi:hypothetical protein
MWDTILDIVKHDHVSIEEIERYMMLKHGLERNKKFASRDAKEFYRAMYDVVAERMKNQSHAEQVVALSEANKALADIRANFHKGFGIQNRQDPLDAGRFISFHIVPPTYGIRCKNSLFPTKPHSPRLYIILSQRHSLVNAQHMLFCDIMPTKFTPESMFFLFCTIL